MSRKFITSVEANKHRDYYAKLVIHCMENSIIVPDDFIDIMMSIPIENIEANPQLLIDMVSVYNTGIDITQLSALDIDRVQTIMSLINNNILTDVDKDYWYSNNVPDHVSEVLIATLTEVSTTALTNKQKNNLVAMGASLTEGNVELIIEVMKNGMLYDKALFLDAHADPEKLRVIYEAAQQYKLTSTIAETTTIKYIQKMFLICRENQVAYEVGYSVDVLRAIIALGNKSMEVIFVEVFESISEATK